MKKLLLLLLCVPLMFSCGEKKEKNEDKTKYVEPVIFKSTTHIIKTQANDTYDLLENATNQEKVKPYKDLADTVKNEADELVNFIQEMKYSLVLKADGKVVLGDNTFTKDYEDLDSADKRKNISFLGAKDDRHSSGDVLNPENKVTLPNVDGEGKATRLKNNILNYRDVLLNILEEARDNNMVPNNGTISALILEINETLGIEDGKVYGEKGNKRTWEYYNFYDMPAVGALTILSTWQWDARNLEAEVSSFLANNIITTSDFKMSDDRAIFVQIKYVDSNNPPIFYIDNNLVKIDSLESILIYQLNTNEKYNKSIVLECDKEVDIEYVVKVMDIARRNNYKITLTTTEK